MEPCRTVGTLRNSEAGKGAVKDRRTNAREKVRRKFSIRVGEGSPGGAVVENLPANAGDTGSSPGLGRSHMPRSGWAHEPQLLSLHYQKSHLWASLVAQWLRIRLPMQGTRVRALVQEDPTCCGAIKPVLHNY
ncbi:hypothetical protein J1605_004569 [Eschrichtius robustus]|uniref:Uncharacterized protein n=1 Tax=Eschrichtius robustus TaxID=9764 RepID=A0AB34HHX4_ESCRO|nr:hypothetical protein J1605_004569 [Eschrichtius robustus]